MAAPESTKFQINYKLSDSKRSLPPRAYRTQSTQLSHYSYRT